MAFSLPCKRARALRARAERRDFVMAKLKALILAGGAVFALARAAAAADLLPPAPALEPLPPAPVEFNGWYLRGDVGIAVNATTPNLVNTPDPLPGNYSPAATQAFNNTTISSSSLFDVGVGYQFNQWLRGDVTVEYRDGGAFQSLYTLNDSTTSTQYAEFYRANTSSLIGLVNAYVDLGTWYGITPFVGAGLGMAHNSLYGMTDQGLVTQGAGGTGGSGGYFGNGTTNNFAWALMAGLDFNVTQNLKLELGYRYLDTGKISSGASSCLNGTGQGSGFSILSCGGSNNYVSSKNELASNDFRIGLRWMIGEEPAYAPPEPLVRKY